MQVNEAEDVPEESAQEDTAGDATMEEAEEARETEEADDTADGAYNLPVRFATCSACL